jgi:FkbM family methyltransferase
MSVSKSVEPEIDAKIKTMIGDTRCFMPTQLAIETVRACNAKCIMCPSTTMKRPKGLMQTEVHETILRKISQWGAPISLITHVGIGEPLLDKMLEERIRREKEVFPEAQIIVYTNGGLLDEERARKLIASGVNTVSFSINGFRKETYETVMQLPRDITYRNVERFCQLKQEINSKVNISVSLIKTEVCSQQEIEEHRHYWQDRHVTVLTPPWISWGNLLKHSIRKKSLPCFFIWKTMVIDNDGTVKRCCEDYDSCYPIGNIMMQEPSEIFNSPSMQRQRDNQLNGDFSCFPMCKNCIETFESARDFWEKSPPLFNDNQKKIYPIPHGSKRQDEVERKIMDNQARKMDIQAKKNRMISILDTSVCDNNLGNQIIMDSVDGYLRQIFPSEFFIRLPFLDNFGTEAIKYIGKSAVTFLGGTNSLSSEMENYKQIGIDHTNYERIRNIVLMGVGWWQYQGAISDHTQRILRHCLHPGVYHSVRDSYTKDKLSTIGINNVIVTGCPTLWPLTQEHCKRIRRSKSENVLLTFTNYSQDKSDLELFNIVKSRYKNIFVWVQGPEDLEYARNFSEKITILPPRLDALDELLSSDIELDYIGTRCHAGIRAMQFMRRSIIIGVDNRAIEMQRDFNLPVLSRANLNSLPKIIDCEFETKLNIPFDKVQQWAGQFSANGSFEVEKHHRPARRDIAAEPVGRKFGFDRGTPIDRIFIDQFLSQNRDFIRGTVLEIAESKYAKQFGSGVTEIDVLHAAAGNPKATIIGNLETGENIPENRYDCIILTQTLHVIYDYRSVIKNCRKALKEDGVLLLTAPGISQISRYDMDRWGDYWRFTTLSLKKSIGEQFGEENVNVINFGNYQLAAEFLNGRAAEEVPSEAFANTDDDYQLLLGVTAVRKETLKIRIGSQGSSMENRITQIASKQCQHESVCANAVMPDLLPCPSMLEHPLVLLYHRVARNEVDAQCLAVSPEHFKEHLEELKVNYRVVSLRQLLNESQTGKTVPNTVALTFDDGYLDNLTCALPLLEKYNMHATIFVTVANVEQAKGFWWDKVEYLFLGEHSLPKILDVSDDDKNYNWPLCTAQQRLTAYDQILALLKSKAADEIEAFVQGLLEWACLGEKGDYCKPVLSISQLQQLSQSSCIEIGAHTLTHARLSALPVGQQEKELVESRKKLESWIGMPVTIFSYPYGSKTDYTDQTKSLVRQAGFQYGIANIQASVLPKTDRFEVPRRLVRDWTGKAFSEWMRSEDKGVLERQTVAQRTFLTICGKEPAAHPSNWPNNAGSIKSGTPEYVYNNLKIKYDNLPALKTEIKNIFEQKIYDFKSDNKSPLVIDGGAHLGLFSLYVKQRYPQARIIAFEPDDHAFALMTANLQASHCGQVHTIKSGLYNQNTTLRFTSDGADGGAIKADGSLEIQVVKLSDYITEDVDYLKLNIEGAELEVLEEIEPKLHRIKELCLEYHAFPEIGQRLHHILDLLDRNGFRYLIHDFDKETNPATKPPFSISPKSRFYLLIYAKRIYAKTDLSESCFCRMDAVGK